MAENVNKAENGPVRVCPDRPYGLRTRSGPEFFSWPLDHQFTSVPNFSFLSALVRKIEGVLPCQLKKQSSAVRVKTFIILIPQKHNHFLIKKEFSNHVVEMMSISSLSLAKYPHIRACFKFFFLNCATTKKGPSLQNLLLQGRF